MSEIQFGDNTTDSESDGVSGNAAGSSQPPSGHAPSPEGTKPQVVVSPKNTGIAIILTVLFGPLGMFYSTIMGGLVMTVLSVIIGVPTLGIGLLITWPISIIWGALSARSHNRKLMR